MSKIYDHEADSDGDLLGRQLRASLPGGEVDRLELLEDHVAALSEQVDELHEEALIARSERRPEDAVGLAHANAERSEGTDANIALRLAGAVAGQHPIQFRYARFEEDGASHIETRRGFPRELFTATSGRRCLRLYDFDRDDHRTFRVGRIVDVKVI